MKRALAAAALFFAACTPNYGDRPVRVAMRGAPLDATVTVDDQLVGKLGTVVRYGLKLLPGRHHITVERPGYFPWDKAVDVDDETLTLDVQLTKVPE